MSGSPITRRLVAIGVLVGVVGVGAVAWAAWTATGSGSATSKAVSALPLTTVDVSVSTPATLYPGATGSALIRINNPNPYPVRVTTVTGSGTITSDVGGLCDASTGVAFVNQTGLVLDVPASAAATFTLAASVTMSNASANACQGAVFTIPVTLAGASNA